MEKIWKTSICLAVIAGDAIKRFRPVRLARKNEILVKKIVTSLSTSSGTTLRVDSTYSAYTFFVLCRLFMWTSCTNSMRVIERR